MPRSITVRLDDADHAVLAREAKRIGGRPEALARVLIRGALSPEVSAPTQEPAARQRAAADRLVRRSRQHPPADAVAMVTQTRSDDLDP